MNQYMVCSRESVLKQVYKTTTENGGDFIYKRLDAESYDDYFVRLFENKQEYKLNCEDIAALLNAETGKEYGSCKYRKEFAAFNRGRIYERKHVDSDVKTRILGISDLHVPYQLPKEIFTQYRGAIDILVINGDISDFVSLSAFPRTYRESPMDELILSRQYLIDLIEYLRPKKVVITYGNHDVRFGNYFAKHVDSDITELLPTTSIELIMDGFTHYNRQDGIQVKYEPLANVWDDIEVEYAYNWFVKVGETIFCHPLAFSSGVMKTAQNAVNWFRNEGYQFDTLVMAHTHRLGAYSLNHTVMYEQGCCCDVDKLQYSNGKLVNKQICGYIYLCQDKDGNNLFNLSKPILIEN